MRNIMEIHITGQHLEITDALRSYVEEKFEKVLQIADNITHIHVILKTDRLDRHVQSVAEATLHIPGTDIHASAASEDMYHGIVLLVEKLIRQVQKYKETR